MELFTNNKKSCPNCAQYKPRLLAKYSVGNKLICSECSGKISLVNKQIIKRQEYTKYLETNYINHMWRYKKLPCD